MKKIIVFCSLYKPNLGGVEKYVENFYNKLPKHNVTIVTSKNDKTLLTEEKDGNTKILRVDSIEIIKGKYYIPTLKGLEQMKKVVKETDSTNSEIHTHTRFYLTNCIATKLAKKFGFQHYHFEHGSSFVKDGSFIVRSFAYLFDMTLAKYILKNSKLIFPISEGVKEFLKEHYKNLTFGPTLYNSYDFRDKNFNKKPKPKTVKLLFVGRLVKAKGVYELIDTAKILKDKNFPFTLTIIGDGSEKEAIERIIERYKLKKEVTMTGKLPYDKTQKEFPKYDIFINPSYTEGLPTTILEAIAHSLLVVATDVGGTREVIPLKYLINIKDLNPETLAKNIIETFESWDNKQGEFYKIAEVARKKFHIDNTIKEYLTL